MASIAETFSNGKGESTFKASFPTKRLSARLFVPGETSTFSYILQGLQGEITLPRTDIFSPKGQNIAYIPGEPLTLTLQYSRLSDYMTPNFMWYFVGIDHNREDLSVQIATALDPIMGEILSNESSRMTDLYHEISALVHLTSQEGLVVVLTSYRAREAPLEISRSEMFFLSQVGHSGPFPPDFIGIFSPYDLIDYDFIPCWGEICPVVCNVLGPDVEKTELRRTGSDVLLEPKVVNSNPWVYVSEYQVMIETMEEQSLTCTATNSNNRSAERVFRLKVFKQ